jgi:hypothetical protein
MNITKSLRAPRQSAPVTNSKPPADSSPKMGAHMQPPAPSMQRIASPVVRAQPPQHALANALMQRRPGPAMDGGNRYAAMARALSNSPMRRWR